MNKDRLISSLTSILGKYIPESRFKELLRYQVYRRFIRHQFYDLDEEIREIKSAGIGILFIELNNGMKFYGSQDKISYLPIKYGDQRRLKRLGDYSFFSSFFTILDEIISKGTYDKYYPIKKGDIVVDIGANIGVFTVKAANIVGNEGKVVAIEPEPANFNLLLKNIQLNRLTNVIAVQKGVWSTKGKLDFNFSKLTGSHSFLREHLENAGKSIVVEVDTVDNILRELDINFVNFIKMDIEGSEIEALKGMKQILKNNVKVVIAAYHLVKGMPTYKTIVPELTMQGFEVHNTEELGMVYGNKIGY